ncbi:DNA polymerase B [Gracilibacillus sp. HCP3S3_G5_1]|uniref:DNA polymerase B n=1 Tax=unclassified Gracilibacillus TaxID=2625209 RepID=UPI003F8C0400
MFSFYDCEVYKHDWLYVFIDDNNNVTRIHNDAGALREHLASINYLVGYNNYAYDDKITAAILREIDAYETSQKIITGKKFRLSLQNPITLDVMQELKGLSLKEAQANLGQSIIETPIDFNIDRPLTNKEIEQVFFYCENDVKVTKRLFQERESYFATKFEMVKEFGLPATSIKKTQATLASEVLKAKPGSDKDRLVIQYDERISKFELPEPVLNFYHDVEKEYKQGVDYHLLEKRKLTYNLAGLEHIYGFGGLHAAKEKYRGEGNYMQIDISSYYPSLIINNQFLQYMDEFKKIYHTRQQLKLSNDPKEKVYKVILTSTYGAMKSKWSKLFHPQMANSIVVNGQLIMTHLICLLEGHCELIQTNTDGIIIKYEKGFEKNIIKLLELFEKVYELSFDVHLISKIAQRDVNNYVIQYKDGKIKAKGRFANYQGGDFERNSLTVIDKALVNYYMKGIKPNKTVVDLWKEKKLAYFQLVAKAGKYDGMAQEVKEDTLLAGNYSSRFVDLQKTNRIFACKNQYAGAVYKTKNGKETKYSKVPYTSENCIVWNDDIKKLDKRQLDLNWYIKQIEGWLF